MTRPPIQYLNNTIIMLLLGVMLLSADGAEPQDQPLAVAGTIDLRHWHFEEDGKIFLNGRWRFDWMALHQTASAKASTQTFIEVPSVWNGQNINDQELDGFGFATYSLRLRLPESRQSLHLNLPEMNMAFKLWANQALIAASGEVGRTAATTTPRSKPMIAQLPATPEIDLVLQISNFYHIEGGIPRALSIGLSNTVVADYELQKLTDVFMIGVLCIVGLHYFALYLGRREETEYLLYALLAMMFLLRVLATSKLPYLFIDHPHIISTRLNYISMFLLPTIYLQFLRSLFPKEVSKYVTYTLLLVGIAGSCWTLMTPAHVFTLSRDPFLGVIQFIFIYAIGVVLLALYRRRDDAPIILILNAVFAMTAINDTLLYQQLILSVDLSQYGFFVFIFGHAVVLGRRMNRAYLRENEARHELALLAESLQSSIVERTADLAEKIEQLESKEQQLAEVSEIAVRANYAKSRFLAGASHDLKQPMQALSLYTQMLESSIKKGTSQTVVANIRASFKGLNTLLDDLISVSQLEAGVIEPEIRAVLLSDCLEGLNEEFSLVAGAKNLKFRMVNSSVCVRTDPELLSRVVRNLINNAIKYTDKGRVLVGCRRIADGVLFQVWDTGTGIEAKDLDSIFNEFSRSNTETSGSGLGLTIAKDMCQILGHEITVSSIRHKGSCFTIKLGTDEPKTATVNTLNTVPISFSSDEFEDLKVLLIEDDDSIRSAMSELLSGWGCLVSEASGGNEALVLLKQMDGAPDLIVSDYHLKSEIGSAIVNFLYEKIGYSVPTIIITADISITLMNELDLTSNKILYKPIDTSVLRSTMSNVLQAYADER